MTDEILLRTTLEPGIVGLTFNRPDKLNALSTPLVRTLEAELDAIASDASVRVVILMGAGERAFVAGADIAEYRGNRAAAFAAYQFESRRVFDKLEALPKPTIAAIRGYALGGGFEVALCCDLIICSHSARLGLPEGLLGLSPGGGGTQRLTRAIGRPMASDIMLAARRITGERAYQVGLAVELTSDDRLLGAALERARAMLKLAPGAQAEMKRLIRQGFDAPLPVAQSLEQEVLNRLYSTHDGQEGIEAFLDKRQPEFRGE
ncbi:3-hydroxybutyryl-CoA dehydratase [Microvirga vignae]|uniref:3-hydroxybutyryl-CoA dehydratase n=1 Tax=Microvirga vignae TaxID=1225564 RepID=A0A0H1RC33_9HYPH|nr:enoyl-CoA hydratase-related protein [Microvirga vignae]KLK92614.1 3-hydroxybutyryl-CoA dehydratase [Microvirga vignae]